MHSRMKFTVAALTYVLNALWNLGMVSCTDDLRAVSSSTDLGKFYLEMKRLHRTRKPKYDNEKDTQAVCDAVLSSALFYYHREVIPVNLGDKWVQDQLTIHADQYPKSLRQNFSDGQATPYSERTFKYLDENIKEYVFPCVAKKRRSEDLELYFISYKYDLGCMVETEHRKERSHMGRFVFECNAKEKRSDLIALAENSIELGEFELKHGREHAREYFFIDGVQINVLCNHLTPLEKLRVCSMALNARDYRGVLLFSSRDEDVQPQCENVDLVYRFLDGHFVREGVYKNVLAFKCLARSVGYETHAVEIFISLGDGKHAFFISSQEGNQTIIKKWFYLYNISPPKRL